MSGPPLVTFALTPQTLLGLVLVIRDSWGLNKLLRAFSLGAFPSFVKQKGFLFVFDKKKNVELTENYTDRRVIRNDLQLMSPQSRQLKADLYLRLSEDLTLPPLSLSCLPCYKSSFQKGTAKSLPPLPRCSGRRASAQGKRSWSQLTSRAAATSGGHSRKARSSEGSL